MKPVFHLVAVVVLLAKISFSSFAQCDTIALAHDSLQFTFIGDYSPTGADYGRGGIEMVKYNDTMYFGGSFGYIGKTTSMFAVVNQSTSELVDYATWPKVNGIVHSAASDGNGGWVIGGNFTKIGDSDRICVAHINSSGQVSGFKANINKTTASNVVNAVVVHNGIVYIGGFFITVNGSSRINLAAIGLSTNVLSSVWNPGANSVVKALTTDNTDIYVGGNFTTLGSSSRSKIGAVNISTGNVTGWNPGANNTVNKILVHNNKVYAGGKFTQIAGVSRQYLGVINKGSGTATSFNAGSLTGTLTAGVTDMTLLGSRLYITGDFLTVQGNGRIGAAALDTIGGTITSWNANANRYAYAIHNNGSKIIIGGDFTYIGSALRARVAVVDTGNATLNSFDAGIDSFYENPVSIRTVQAANGNIYIGGEFFGIKGEHRSGLAAINLSNNKILPTFKPDVEITGISNKAFEIEKITIDSGIMYIGGRFDKINGQSRKNVASINIANNYAVTSWNPFNVSGNFIQTLAIEIDSSYAYIGGNFNFVYNGNHRSVVRVHKTTGVIDYWTPTMSSNNPPYVAAIKLINNKAYMGGNLFNTSNAHSGMQYYNFSNSTEYFYNITGDVLQMYFLGNKLFLGGLFSQVNSTTRRNFAAIDSGSTQLLGWNVNTWVITGGGADLYTFKNKLLVLGEFWTGKVNNVPRQYVAMVDTITGAVAPAWHPVPNSNVKRALNIGDTLFLTGDFKKDDMGTKSVRNLWSFARFHLGGFTTPTVTITTATDTLCAGASVTVNATTNVSNGTYIWKKNNSTQAGSGSGFTFTPSDGDKIKCLRTVPSNGCYLDPAAISNEIVFKVNANTTPTISLTASGDSLCAGNTVNYSVTTNVVGAHYQWKVDNTNVGTDTSFYSYIPANGHVVSCKVIRDTGTCYSPAYITEDTTMTVIPNIIPSIQVIAYANPVCQGSTDTIVAFTNITGGSFQWRINGNNVGGNTKKYGYIPANNDTVDCIINVPSTGCYLPDADTSSVVITHKVPVLPNIDISVFPDTIICSGTSLTFNSSNTNGGTNPVYQWFKNGTVVSGAVQSVYTDTGWQDNDKVFCVMICDSAVCAAPGDDTSNLITIHVTPVSVPSVSIAANPGTTIPQGTMVTFNATASNIGTSTQYQWRINGANVSGQVANSYMTNAIADNDMVSVVVYSNDSCSNPDTALSNTLDMTVKVSVGSINKERGIKIYPNPTQGTVVIAATSVINNVTVTNIVGQKIISENTNSKMVTIDLNDTAPGIYIIKVNDSYVERIVKE